MNKRKSILLYKIGKVSYYGESYKKLENFVVKNAVLVGIIVGGIIFGGVVYASNATASSITFSNGSTNLTATNVQKAIDALYLKSKESSEKIVAAYTYNSSSCVTGDESSCVKTTCYQSKTSRSCPAGTIIDYKVNSSTTVRFHALYDSGSTMTMQSQKATIYKRLWNNLSSSNTS